MKHALSIWIPATVLACFVAAMTAWANQPRVGTQTSTIPYVFLGDDTDGSGVNITEEGIEAKDLGEIRDGAVLFVIGGCTSCVLPRVDALPIRDESGRKVFLVTNDRSEYVKRKAKNRPTLLDPGSRLKKKLLAKSGARMYIINSKAEVVYAETGEPKLDEAHGFPQL